jgi:hypothetical protein
LRLDHPSPFCLVALHHTGNTSLFISDRMPGLSPKPSHFMVDCLVWCDFVVGVFAGKLSTPNFYVGLVS